MGDDLSELKMRIAEVIARADASSIGWVPHGTDNQVLASALDLADRMAELTSRTLRWEGRDHSGMVGSPRLLSPPRVVAAAREQLSRSVPAEASTGRRRRWWGGGGAAVAEVSLAEPSLTQAVEDDGFAVFISHHRAAAGSDARFLHAQLERALGRRCFFDGRDADDINLIIEEGLGRSKALLLLQTKDVLTRPWVLLECYEAVRRGLPVVTVRLDGRDYDYDDARNLLANLRTELPLRNPGALADLEARAGMLGVDVGTIQSTLAATLPHLISAEYDPAGSDNQVNAALRDIVDRLRRQFRRQERARAASGGSGGTTTGTGSGSRNGSGTGSGSRTGSEVGAAFSRAASCVSGVSSGSGGGGEGTPTSAVRTNSAGNLTRAAAGGDVRAGRGRRCGGGRGGVSRRRRARRRRPRGRRRGGA